MKRLLRYDAVAIAALVLAVAAWGYKQVSFKQGWREAKTMKQEVAQLQRAVALQELWRAQNIRIDELKRFGRGGAQLWQKSGKKIKASYKGLDIKSLNGLLTKLMRMPLQIVSLRITESANKTYDVELVCKRS